MKTAIIVIILSVASFAFADPSAVPSKKSVYRVKCPECGKEIVSKPKWVGCNGNVTLPDNKVKREYGIRFRCRCGNEFSTQRTLVVKTEPAQEVEPPASAKPTRAIKSPKDQ